MVMNLVTRTADLVSACRRFEQAEFITVDTEFIRDNTYWPRLCLVQVASQSESIAIDPIGQELDLDPFLELLTNRNVPKVFHAARQDIEIFFQLGGIIPTPLFDTQLAAMVCGFGDSVGYDTLVRQLLGFNVDKSSRLSDWSRRPLTERQIAYALDDVVHLLDVYVELKRRVQKSNREQWLAEELAVLTNPQTYINLPEEAWRRIKSRSHNRRYLAILRDLAAWREREAQSRDVPRNRVLRDEALVEIAAHPPASTQDLKHFRIFPKGLANQADGTSIIEMVAKVLATPEQDLPKPEPRSNQYRAKGPIVDLLKVLLKAKCEEHDVAQKLVASVEDLEHIVADGEADIPALVGWRHEVFGEDALKLKRGEIALAADVQGVRLIAIDKKPKTN